MAYKNSGFTIVELMIAMTIFAIASTLVLSGVLFIARQYRQANTRIAIEDASRNIHQQVIQAAQFSKNDGTSGTFSGTAPSGYKGVCVGDDIYFFGNETINDTNPAAYDSQAEGLWVQQQGADGCSWNGVSTSSATNLLPVGAKTIEFTYNNSRLNTLFVMAPDNTYLQFGATASDTRCDTNTFGREFCSAVKLQSTSIGRIK